MSEEEIGVSVSEEEIGAFGDMSEEEIGASVTAVDTHFSLVDKYGQSYISTTSTMLLGLGATTLSRTKGIKLSPGQTFRYDGGKKPKAGGIVNKLPQKKHSLYLYEAGISPKHVDTLQHEIYIYVRGCKDKDPIVVGILSREHPTVSLELTLSEDFQLSHSSKRKEVFFNGFRFTLWKTPKLFVGKNKRLPGKVVWSRPRPVTLEAKEVWGILV